MLTATPETEVQSLELWLSADVAKKNFVASWRLSSAGPATPADVRRMKTRTFERTRQGAQDFLEWGESVRAESARLCVVMEATGPYSVELTAWLTMLRPGLNVVVVRPKLMKDYVAGIGIRNKTDKLDARAIAVFGSERRPAAPEPTGEKYCNLRALTRWRQSLIEHQSAVSNLSETIGGDNLSAWVRKQIAQQHKQTLAALELQIDKVELLIKQLVDGHEDLKRDVDLLESINGVGFRTATAVLGELGDLRRFNTSRQLTAFAGLNPVLIESGTRKGKSRISKQGSSRARRALYMAAMAGIRSSQTQRQRYDANVARGKTKMTALIANMRWLVVTMRGVLKSKKQYDPHFKRNCGKNPQPGFEHAA